MDKAEFFKSLREAEKGKTFPPAPAFTDGDIVSTVRSAGTPKEAFERNFTANHGEVLNGAAELSNFLRSKNCRRGYVDPMLETAFGLEESFEIEREFDRADADRYDFAISKAAGAVGEGGMIILKDSSTSDRLATIAPWVHVAVLDTNAIFGTIPEALESVADNPYTIFVAGPSKTADVEGILIEGVHGPGLQVCLFVG